MPLSCWTAEKCAALSLLTRPQYVRRGQVCLAAVEGNQVRLLVPDQVNEQLVGQVGERDLDRSPGDVSFDYIAIWS